jgi:hypothetical protein
VDVVVPKVEELRVVLCALVYDCVCVVVRIKHFVKAVIDQPQVFVF